MKDLIRSAPQAKSWMENGFENFETVKDIVRVDTWSGRHSSSFTLPSLRASRFGECLLFVY